MTAILGIKGKDYVLVASDTRISTGNLKLPFNYSKTKIICENILVSGSGSVGNLQQILKMALRNCRIEKALGDFEQKVELEDVIKAISDLNFSMPLEYKHYSPFSFLIGGINDQQIPTLFSVGSDGSVIEIPTFYADGSGGQLALATLSKGWKPELTLEEAKLLAMESLRGSSNHDLYTNAYPEFFVLNIASERWNIEKFVLNPETKEEKPEEKEVEEKKE